MTANRVWFDVAKDLYDEGIAMPILWLGDDRLFPLASETFGCAAVRMLDFVHRPYDIPDIEYSGEHADFFQSQNYIKAKDICIKMMERLDLYGVFSRLDREAYFHKLTIWALKFFHNERPEALLMIEKPHSHAQYLIYQISKYLNLRIANFKDCPLFPVNFLQYNENLLVEKKDETDPELFRRFDEKLKRYVESISSLKGSQETYHPPYIKKQIHNARIIERLKRAILFDLIRTLREVKHDWVKRIKGEYNPINPYRNGLISRYIMRSRRRGNLKRSCQNSVNTNGALGSYVYFPLHFEPERTTTPDGGDFHDHFVALIALRKFLPSSINIVVKEHPSQFFLADRGSRGRSPLFYNLIKNIKGVIFVGTQGDSIDLIKGSNFVATITGSVGVEAALMGKIALTFGNTWYADCPNTVQWRENLTFEELEKLKLSDETNIYCFLIDKIKRFGVPTINNMSAHFGFQNEWTSERFYEIQRVEAGRLIKSFLKDETGVNK